MAGLRNSFITTAYSGSDRDHHQDSEVRKGQAAPDCSGMLGLQTPTHGTQGPWCGKSKPLGAVCAWLTNTTSWAQLSSHHSPGTKHVEWRTLLRIPVLCHSCLPQHLCLLSWDSDTVEQQHGSPEFLTHRDSEHNKMVKLSHITKSWTGLPQQYNHFPKKG